MKIKERIKKALPAITTVAILAIPAAWATYDVILSVARGGTGASTASGARSSLGAAASGANSDITSLSGLTTALSIAQGGTNATTAAGARTSLGAAASGTNSDITELTGLTTALSATQGGTAQSTWTTGDLLYASGSNTLSKRAIGSTGHVLTVSGGVPTWAANDPAQTITAHTGAGTGVVGFNTADATGGAFAVTLPAASAAAGKTLEVKKIDSSANAVTVTRAGSDTIDGATTYALSAQYQSVTLVSDGSASWYVK